MRNTIGGLIIVLALVAMANTTNAAQTYTWQDVDQISGPVKPKPEAYLKVYSEATVYRDADVPEVGRVPYTIYSADGQKIKWVPFNDEAPRLVTLPPGKYIIVPVTNITKTLVYGAVLKQGMLTEVHMRGEDPSYAPYQF